MALIMYSRLFVFIDDALQVEACDVSLITSVGIPDRVTIVSAVPERGMEFDPRPWLGSDKTFKVGLAFGTRPLDEALPKAAEFDGQIVEVQLLGSLKKTGHVSFTLERVAPSVNEPSGLA